MRKKIVAGNWKMNLNLQEGKSLVEGILAGLPMLNESKEVVLCPPFIHLGQTATQLDEYEHIYLGAQNCSSEASGAYTGEVSAAMLQSVGAQYVIIGHSERREYFNEDDALLGRKVEQALATDMKVIFCCGESLEIRDANAQNEWVEKQLKSALFHLGDLLMQRIVIAYEPIWAIGTGRTATAAQAQEMHAHIRNVVARQYNPVLADNMTILYGGSAKPSNAAELFACPDVDGGLIGGASLKAEDFLGIINAMMAS
jgi:triosephosphate isomerase